MQAAASRRPPPLQMRRHTTMETAKAKGEEAVIWSKQNLEPPGKTDGGEETRGDAHVL